jgi:hypothetical protein
MAALCGAANWRAVWIWRYESDVLPVSGEARQVDLRRWADLHYSHCHDAKTGQGKFSLGPSVVLLVQPGHWTVGVLINNVFSVAGSAHRPDVNQMLLQYFVNYNLKKGWYLASGPIVTANWNSAGTGEAATGNDTTGGTRGLCRLGAA